MLANARAVYAAVFFAKLAAAGGGLGGGGLLMPIFLLLGGVPPSVATPLSIVSIAGGAVANYLAYSRRRQHSGQPLIDYNAALVMLPPLLAGSTWGTLLDAVLPESLLVHLLLLLLSVITYRTLRKGLQSWTHAQEEALSSRAHAARPPPLFPARALLLALLSWSVVLAASLARGGHGAPSLLPGGVPCGSLRFWLLFALAQCALGALTLVVRVRLDSAGGGEKCEDGAEATPRHREAAASLTLPACSFAAGAAAGMLGIGGGMMVAPLLLELGVEARSVAATGAFVVLVADTSVATQFGVLGLLPRQHGAALAALSFCGTGVGQFLAERAVVAAGGGGGVGAETALRGRRGGVRGLAVSCLVSRLQDLDAGTNCRRR